MTDQTMPIPAGPGWYVEEDEEGEISLDPVIAWLPASDAHGEPTLLPFVNGGTCEPPILLTADAFSSFRRHVVYRPNHDPEDRSVIAPPNRRDTP